MRYKGRVIKDREIVNIPGESVAEIRLGDGITELRQGIDVITMMPVMKKKKVKSKNMDRFRAVSVMISALCTGFAFTGMFALPEICIPVLVGNFTLGFLILCGWRN